MRITRVHLTPSTADREELIRHLGRRFILFGEWCYAVHTVRYSRLPDWFLAFDLYDRSQGVFAAADVRDEIVRSVHLQVVPHLGTAHHNLESLKLLLGTSALGAPRGEGLYLRTASSVTPVVRAKLVTPEFTQLIGQHWSRRSLQANSLEQQRAEVS